MKNIKEKVQFPLGTLIGFEMSEATKKAIEEVDKTIKSMTKEDKDEKLSKVMADLTSTYTDKEKEMISKYGVETHINLIDVHMSLGEFLYSLFMSHTKEPVSPLQKDAFLKKKQSLAAEFTKDEFEIPKEVANLVEEVMNDDAKWEKSSFGVSVKVEPKKKDEEIVEIPMVLNSVGASYYKNIIEAMILYFNE